MGTGAAYSEAETQLIRELWTEGQSASEISQALWSRFGRRRSRNAVMGVVHRSGLKRNNPGAIPPVRSAKRKARPTRRTASAPKPPPQPRAKPAPDKARARKAVPAGRPHRRRAVKPSPPPAGGLTVLELTGQTCCFPLTAALPHRFCGHAVLPGKSWCAAHAAIVFQKDEAPV